MLKNAKEKLQVEGHEHLADYLEASIEFEEHDEAHPPVVCCHCRESRSTADAVAIASGAIASHGVCDSCYRTLYEPDLPTEEQQTGAHL